MKRTSRTTELLAPAGERASAYAAFAFGADAIYTGLSRFSARAEAVNLTPEELEEVTTYAHALPRPRQVYVTLNTLLREAELPDLIRSLGLCEACGVDAIIVQDLGVAQLARKHFPSLRLHASTQLAIHNLEGVRAAARLGFRRVTLARELTLDEIKSIASQAPVQVEAFLHGALCYSYSGLCLYSALLRGRSGNRGACAYPCRDSFCPSHSAGAAPGGSGLVFSMKDLAGGTSARDLAKAGVASLKIEGRKKSPLYVAAAVNYHRKLLDHSFQGGEQEACANDLRTIFSRPWTPLYLHNRTNRRVIDPKTTGHRGAPIGRVYQVNADSIQFKNLLPLEVHDGLQFELEGETRPFGFAVEEIRLENGRRAFEVPANQIIEVPLPAQAPRDIPRGTRLFLSSSQAVKRRYRFETPNPRELRQRLPIEITLTLSESAVEATATLSTTTPPLVATAAMEGPFEPARNAEAMQAGARKSFAKLGDTPFELKSFAYEGPPLFIPVSRLNTLRRELTTTLETVYRQHRDQGLDLVITSLSEVPVPDAPAPEPPSRILKTDQPSALLAAFPNAELPRISEVIVELGRESIEQIDAFRNALPESIALRLALPIITRSWDREPLGEQIRHFFDAGIRSWEAANLSALEFIPKAEDLDLSADWALYTMNSSALASLRERGITRFTLSPEDTTQNMTVLAQQHPWQLVWPVHRDPPLFISDSCPHAARLGYCPGPKTCDFTEQTYTSKTGESVRSVNRDCRIFTLLDKPQITPVPPGLPVLPRLDFLIRDWHPKILQQVLLHQL
jgi:U32 family peptidase